MGYRPQSWEFAGSLKSIAERGADRRDTRRRTSVRDAALGARRRRGSRPTAPPAAKQKAVCCESRAPYRNTRGSWLRRADCGCARRDRSRLTRSPLRRRRTLFGLSRTREGLEQRATPQLRKTRALKAARPAASGAWTAPDPR